MRTVPTHLALLLAAILIAGCLALFTALGLIPLEAGLVAGLCLAAVGMAALVLRAVRAPVRVAPPGPSPSAAVQAHGPERFRAIIEAYNSTENPDVPQIVDYIINQAAAANSSDIHLVPYRDFLTIRYRIDGILTDMAQLASHLKEPVTNRLKVLTQLLTYVHDTPQDGRFDVPVGQRRVDLRVAFMPTLHGERIVMRLLDRAEVEIGLEHLGLTDSQLRTLSSIISRPQGMVILTGPTGSGKTTTIYCALRAILQRSQNSVSIYTLEDPIEYDLLNINQTQIEESQGFTFSKGLRTMLRQDPDVIMVGEIRDLETARIAIQAGMTGHLIITTVHAKSAAGVFLRLIEMGVDPPSVASAVTAVVAQRLVRALCPHCKNPEKPTPGQEAKIGRPLPPGARFHAPVGCSKCGMKGYIGRRGIFEILEVTESVRRSIVQRATSEQIHREFAGGGVKTLEDNGLEYAARGETSLDELLRVLPLRSDLE